MNLTCSSRRAGAAAAQPDDGAHPSSHTSQQRQCRSSHPQVRHLPGDRRRWGGLTRPGLRLPAPGPAARDDALRDSALPPRPSDVLQEGTESDRRATGRLSSWRRAAACSRSCSSATRCCSPWGSPSPSLAHRPSPGPSPQPLEACQELICESVHRFGSFAVLGSDQNRCKLQQCMLFNLNNFLSNNDVVKLNSVIEICNWGAIDQFSGFVSGTVICHCLYTWYSQ
jgi:hypothetical protein